jgi:hypothetical protein
VVDDFAEIAHGWLPSPSADGRGGLSWRSGRLLICSRGFFFVPTGLVFGVAQRFQRCGNSLVVNIGFSRRG